MVETSRIVVAAGAWSAEATWIAEVERRLPAGSLPARPVLVLVPSHSLRQHVLGRLAGRRPAWLGLEVTTLAGASRGILERTGAAPAPGDPLVPVLVRRLAARQPALVRALGTLRGGYDEIGGAVRDLLDAGFVEEHLDAVVERLAAERALVGPSAVERGIAIARVAAELRRELAALGLPHGSELLAEAARQVATDPERALPGRCCIVHGFADVTGVGADLLESLVRHRPTLVVFDSPAELDGSAAPWRFGSRLLERLAGIAPVEASIEPPIAALPVAVDAADPAREARAAVSWLRGQAGDEAPESSAIVARDLDPDLAALWRELDRQGLAASADAGVPSPLGRRVRGLIEALATGGELDPGVALALGRDRLAELGGTTVEEVRLALALEGVRSLDGVEAWQPPADTVRLPVASGLVASENGGESEGGRVTHRRVPGGVLARARSWLSRLRSLLHAMRSARTIGENLATLRAVLRHALPEAEAAALSAALDPLEPATIAALVVDGEEWRLLVDHAWRDLSRQPLGGGGGIALLTVTEARGRTFDRLAVVGLTRDRFPRAVRPDPLLPDPLRFRLRELLPDLPVKAEGHDEERYLFAQLVSSARATALFRARADGRGRALAASPLLEELRRAEKFEAATPPSDSDLVSALDLATAGALRRGPRDLSRALASAALEGRLRFGGGSVEIPAATASRAALLAEFAFDATSARYRRLGPFMGAIGPTGPTDPRHRFPAVTTLENLARCAWKTFLERVLQVQALPELGDPLPALPRRLVGSVVHDVLEGLAGERTGLTLDALATLEPLRVEWPARAELERRTRDAAHGQLVREMLDPALFETALVREALERLDVASETDWASGALELLGAEVQGEAVLTVGGVERRLPFRVDRVDRTKVGLRLTDYKTGAPLTDVVTPAKQAEKLASAIGRGEALQLPLYVLGAGQGASARYLNLTPGIDERLRVLSLEGEGLPAESLAALLEALLAIWSSGVFPPRLLEHDGSLYHGCSYCDVRSACQQGDSSAKRRMLAWLEGKEDPRNPLDGAARAWWDLSKP